MRIAVISSSETGVTDRAMVTLAKRLITQGWRIAGTVQTNSEVPGRKHCDMDVQILPNGPVIQINQRLGEGASGCRLDAGALETAVAAVEQVFAKGADVLIINKFGKHEAEGRGFRALIAEALGQGVPVICAVNDLNKAAFEVFTDGLAEPLPARVEDMTAWLRAARLAEVA